MGFSYTDWRGVFYPRGLEQGRWLSHYAERFNAIELDTTFHAIPPRERVEKWRDAVPDDFRFACKMSRGVTHDRVPDDPAGRRETIEFLHSMSGFGEKLSWVLVQYPPTLMANEREGVLSFLARLSPRVRGMGAKVAVEFRHTSWLLAPGLVDDLHAIGVTLVWAEYDVPAETVPVASSHDVYLRLIGTHDRYKPLDHERWDPTPNMQWWIRQMSRLEAGERWVLFNNDYSGFSIASMNRLRTLVGMPPAILPEPEPKQMALFGD